MSSDNPTALRIGSTGTLDGVYYQVIGRMAMSVMDGGGLYYWNEFNLRTDSGAAATLVYEETIRGGQWRLFTMFSPETPMNRAEAAAAKYGDRLNLDGEEVRVTFVGESRVAELEGQTPPGETPGKTEDYFNAEAGLKMVVVSWTDRQMEFYHGHTLNGWSVEKAFGIPPPPRSDYAKIRFNSGPHQTFASMAIGLAVALGIFVFLTTVTHRPTSYRMSSSRPRPPAVRVFPQPPSPLTVGATGRINGNQYRIIGHDVVEESEVGFRFVRHEYQLQGDDGSPALLVFGQTPGAKDWWLLTPLHPADPMSPTAAGAVRSGDNIKVDDVAVRVNALFCSTARPGDDYSTAGSARTGPLKTFGFSGTNATELLLARWSETNITFHHGTSVDSQVVLTAFQ